MIKFIEKKVPEGLDLIVVIFIAPALVYGLASLINPSVTAVLNQIAKAVNSVGDSSPYALAIILGLIIPVTSMTPLSSMVLASILGLTGLPMAIGAIVCTGASFVNFTLFNILKIGDKPNRFAVFIEPLTQIDLIVKYAPVLYGTNAIIGMVNACIIAFSGLKIGVTGMATPMAGAIVLFGFNSPIKSIITIAAVAVTGLILASIIGSLIKKFDLLHLHIPMPWNKGKSQS